MFTAADAGALPDVSAEPRTDDFTPLGAGDVQGAAYGYRTPRVIPAFREHLFYGLLLDMKAMYRAGSRVGSPDRHAQFLPLHGRPDRPGTGRRITLTEKRAVTFGYSPLFCARGISAFGRG